jgi:hypothetical protein
MTDQDKIKELEAEVSRLQTICRRHGVALLPKLDLPSTEERDALLAAVLGKYPFLKGPADFEASYKTQFTNALKYFCVVYRLDRPETQYSISSWTDQAKAWLQSNGYNQTEMTLRPFIAAAIASGIKYNIDEFPHGVEIGISLGSAPPSSAWRNTLRDGVPKADALRNRVPVRAQTNIDVRSFR